MTSQAFEQLAVKELKSVTRMAFHLTHRQDQADDLVQDIYLRAIKAQDRFDPDRGGMRPWLLKILHNNFYTMISRKRRDFSYLEGVDDLIADSRSESLGSSDSLNLNWDQVDQRLKHAIEDLDVRYRQVLMLWAVDGLKYREIADVLDLPIGTVMSRLHRARAILSSQLTELAAENRMINDARVASN